MNRSGAANVASQARRTAAAAARGRKRRNACESVLNESNNFTGTLDLVASAHVLVEQPADAEYPNQTLYTCDRCDGVFIEIDGVVR